MKNRLFGKSKIKVGEVGLGCWQFGGDFGSITDQTAFEIMDVSVENGINFFDTADVYGAGRSESLIGKFLKTRKKKVYIATKFGRQANVYPDSYTKEKMQKAIEDSLSRLRVEAIDLLQLHCIPFQVIKEGEVFEWLRSFKTEGKIKSFGASIETVEEGLYCIEQEGLESLQVIFSIYRQKPASELFSVAKEKGVSIIVRLPLASGLLSGKFSKQTKFESVDHRKYNKNGEAFNVGETFAGIPFEKGVEISDKLKSYVPEGITMAQMALRWILDHKEVTVIIPGASRPEQSKMNAYVSEIAGLSGDLHDVLKEFYNKEVHHYIRGPY